MPAGVVFKMFHFPVTLIQSTHAKSEVQSFLKIRNIIGKVEI